MQLLRIGTDEQPVSVADINVTVERESAVGIHISPCTHLFGSEDLACVILSAIEGGSYRSV